MFKLVGSIALSTTLLFSSWLTKENLKNYPTLYHLSELEVENNQTLLDPRAIYKGDIQKYSQDGSLWFTPSQKELWHHNYYGKAQVVQTDEIYKLESKTPLTNSFTKVVPLNKKSLLFSSQTKDERVYLFEGVTELDLTKKGRIIFKHRLIMNNSSNTNEEYTLSFLVDDKRIDKRVRATFNPQKHSLDGEEIFVSSLENVSIDLPKDVKRVKLLVDKPLLGSIEFLEDIENSLAFDHNLEEMKLPATENSLATIDNKYKNSATVNALKTLEQGKDFFQYPNSWSKSYRDAFRDLPFRALLPKELPLNSYLKSGYFLPKEILVEEKEESYPKSIEKDYLTKVNSGTFIGIKGFIEEFKKEQEFIKEIHFELDDAKTRPQFLKDLKSVALKFSQGKYKTLIIKSHTDSRGSDAYNLALSKRRAEAAVFVLESLGVDRAKIVVIPKGESELKRYDNTEEAHRINRRVEIYGNFENIVAQNTLQYPLPDRKNHWLRISTLKELTDPIEMFVDDKLYGTLEVKESNTTLKKSFTEKLLTETGTENKSFIWYRSEKDLLNTSSIELFLEKGTEISFKSKSGELVPIYVEIRDDKNYFFDEDTLIELFSYSKKRRAQIVEDGLFNKNSYSNGLLPLKEFLNSRKILFEKSIDKDTKVSYKDLKLLPKLLKSGELPTAIRISKYFATKKNRTAEKFLEKIYSGRLNENEFITFKAYQIDLYKDSKNFSFLEEYFYKNSSYKLALLSSLSQEISFKTIKIAEKLKLFRLADKLKERVTEKAYSEDIWSNISHKIQTSGAIAKINNKRVGNSFIRYLGTKEKSVKLKVQGPTTLKIESRSLTNSQGESYDNWLTVNINGADYIAPIFASFKSSNLELDNISGGVGESSFSFVTLPKGEFSISIYGDNPTLLGFWQKENDFKERFSKHKSFWHEDTLYRVGNRGKRDYLKLISLLNNYENSGDEAFAIEGTAICQKNKSQKEFIKLCSRIQKDLTWVLDENFISNAGIVRERSSYTKTKNRGTLLKRELLDKKDAHTLLGDKTKVTYKILKRERSYSTIKVERVSYGYHQQNFPMKVTVSVGKKRYTIVLSKGESKNFRIPLTKEINPVTFQIESDDIGTFANIVVDGKEPTFTSRYYLTTPTYPLTFIGEEKSLYRASFQNGDERFYYFDREKEQKVKTSQEQKLQLYKLKLNKFKAYEPKAVDEEKIIEKATLTEPSIDLFKNDSYKKAKIYEERCLDYYTLLLRERKASDEDVSSKELEEFVQLGADLSCRHKDFFTGLNIFARDHLNHSDTTVFGVGGKLYYKLNKNISLEGKIDGKFQNSSQSIFNQSLSSTYRFPITEVSNVALKLTLFNRDVEDKNSTKYIDKDIFSTYKNDHQFGARFSTLLSHTPYEDLRFTLALGAVSNEDFSIDNYYSRFGVRALMKAIEGYGSFTVREYLSDDNRKDSVTKESLVLDLKTYDWLERQRRLELFLRSEFDLSDSENYSQIGVRLYFDSDYFYKNSYPSSEYFKRLKILKNWDEY